MSTTPNTVFHPENIPHINPKSSRPLALQSTNGLFFLFIFRAERKHTKQKQFFRYPGKFQTALFSKLCYINAVSGHTADLGMRTEPILCSPAGITQRTSAIPQTKALQTGLTQLLRKPQNGSVVGFLRIQDCLLVIIASDIPNCLQYQCLILCHKPLPHFFHGAAIRGTGIVCIIKH